MKLTTKQAAGCNIHFEDYRIRISYVLYYSAGAEPVKTWVCVVHDGLTLESTEF